MTTTTTKEQTKEFCRYHGIMCEYATNYGYCKITGCAKLYDTNCTEYTWDIGKTGFVDKSEFEIITYKHCKYEE